MPRHDVHDHWRPWVDRLVAHRLRIRPMEPGPYHAAALVRSPKEAAWVAYGENSWSLPSPLRWTRHAEVNALLQLNRSRALQVPHRMTLVVVRTSLTGHWGLSKPCGHCLCSLLKHLPPGCHVDRIVYTAGPDAIHVATFTELFFDEPWFISQFYRSRNWGRTAGDGSPPRNISVPAT